MAPFARRRAPIYVSAAFFGCLPLGADVLLLLPGRVGLARRCARVSSAATASLRGRQCYSCVSVGAGISNLSTTRLSLPAFVSFCACSVEAGLHCLAVSRRAAG